MGRYLRPDQRGVAGIHRGDGRPHLGARPHLLHPRRPHGKQGRARRPDQRMDARLHQATGHAYPPEERRSRRREIHRRKTSTQTSITERAATSSMSTSPHGAISHTRACPASPSLSEAHGDGPPPWLGDHNDYVFKTLLNLTQEEYEAGQNSGAIR